MSASVQDPAPVTVSAPGKINVSLQVGPLRPDGYHAVASVYLALSLREEVRAAVAARPGITVSVEGGGPLQIPVAGIPLGPENLVARAAAALAAYAGIAEPAVDLTITKRVPVAGGMGGGSADAAAALLACNLLWGTGLEAAELRALAAGLGADVPFALEGGAAVGLGVGDQLTEVPAEIPLHWVLVASGSGLSTPAVYGRLDALRAEAEAVGAAPAPEPSAADPRVLEALLSGNAAALAGVISNDLQSAALSLAPELEDVLECGRRLGALAGIVSGSGPTLAFLAADAASAAQLEEALRAEGHNALAVHGPVPGAAAAADRT